MSGNPPPIILLTSSKSTSSSPVNSSNQSITTHPMTRSPIIVHQQTMQPASPSTPFKNIIVRPYRDSIQQALTKTNNADTKPILLSSEDVAEAHQPNKRIALESTDLNNPSLTFSAVPKSEVLSTLQSVSPSRGLPLTAMMAQPPSTNSGVSTLRFVAQPTFIHPNDVSAGQSPGQQVLFQQRRNLVLSQPVMTLHVPQDSITTQKENKLQTPYLNTDSNPIDTRIHDSQFLPIQYQRKPCNCTKSMCLKLYCDCFANGLNCQNCACLNCHNDSRHEDDRKKAIAATLERNPNAFKSKMYKFANTTNPQTDRPLKGCNCKKSSCHKRYCECYESRVPCTNLCKCIGCKNTEQAVHPLNVGFYRSGQPKATAQTPLDQIPRIGPPVESATPNNVFNMEVTEALATCLLVTAQQCEMNQMSELESQEAILKEFQRCMHQVVQTALGRTTSPSSFI